MTITLFERLGGRNSISNIVDDTVKNHMNNPKVNARFLPLKDKPKQLAVIKQHTIDFLSAGSGDSATYKEKIWSLHIRV